MAILSAFFFMTFDDDQYWFYVHHSSHIEYKCSIFILCFIIIAQLSIKQLESLIFISVIRSFLLLTWSIAYEFKPVSVTNPIFLKIDSLRSMY